MAMDQNDPVSRRHAASGSVQREAATSPGFNLEAVGHPGVSGEPKEECIVPNQEIGTPRNSSKMLISFPRPKMHSITQLASSLVAKERVTLRDQARIMGTMVAAYLSVLPAPLHYHFPNHLPYQAKVEMTRDMVDQRSQQAQRERLRDPSVGPRHRVSCLRDGLGSVLTRTCSNSTASTISNC